MLEHEVFDGPRQLLWHDSLLVTLTVLSHHKLTQADSSRDLSLEAELDQINCIESREAGVRLARLTVNVVSIAEACLEDISQKAHLLVVGDWAGLSSVKVLVVETSHVSLFALLALYL